MVIKDKKLYSKTLHLVGAEADALDLECYVIGGWVRDLLLHRESKDIDIVVVGSGITIAEAVHKRIKGSHLAIFKSYGTAQVKKGDLELEFVGARRESYHRESRNPYVEEGTLEDDQNRRDFTINALAICLNKGRYGELLDPFNGIKDLQNGIIRTPLNPDITFSDDPLRMMRAVRFATQLGFCLNISTFEAIQRNKERINIISAERIADELNKIMMSPRPSVGWKLLDKTGLLDIIFPELSALKGVETVEGRGHKDIFLHTLQVLDSVAEATAADDSSNTEAQVQHASRPQNVLWLRWAALMHDIGKPRSKKWEDGVGWTFHNHNYIGKKMIPRIFKRMHLPQNEKMSYVQKLVDLHMRPIALIEDTITDSAVRRLLFEAGDDIDDLMILCHADITSKNEDKVKRYHQNYELVREKLKIIEEKDRIRQFQPPVRGEEIMEMLDIPPCALVGELKTLVKDAILDGIIPNEHDPARDFVLTIAKLTDHYGRQEAVEIAKWIAEEPRESYDIEDVIKRLLNDEPLQYIFGHTDWLGLRLNLNSSTLIPRPETADLVFAIEEATRGSNVSVLDIGTGSGCIAIALKKRHPQWLVAACDISEEALHQAKENARINETDVQFFQCDILNLENTGTQEAEKTSLGFAPRQDAKDTMTADHVTYIVSNPPYITESEKAAMRPNVLQYEPQTALFVPDDDPLLFYRHIAQYAKQINAGALFFEINERFGKETIELMNSMGFKDVLLKKDINGKDRIVIAK